MLLRKSKPPTQSQEEWTFLSPVFYNAPSLHTVEKSSNCVSYEELGAGGKMETLQCNQLCASLQNNIKNLVS